MQHLRVRFADLCRTTRVRLDISQQELADAVGISRGYLANIELARANPTIDLVARLATALGLELSLDGRPPTFLRERRSGDLVHARCLTHAHDRLETAGWRLAREVEVSDGRVHGWVDLLAFDPRTGTLLVIEIKTRLDDIGAVERHLGWYARRVGPACVALGWTPKATARWLLVLASTEVDDAIHGARAALARAFPSRAPQMLAVVDGAGPAVDGIALIDPTSRRRDWLIRSRADGRRTMAPFHDYAAAAERLRDGHHKRPVTTHGATIGG
jgi:transcriptional regulator with XRE-family HTH domain